MLAISNSINFINNTKTFYTNKNTTPKGIKGFGNADKPLPDIQVLPNTSSSFVQNITKKIKEFPSKWLAKFKEQGYDIVLAPSVREAYGSKNVFAPNIIKSEFENPKGLVGTTFTSPSGTNFFTFCDKPPNSEKYMEGIVNHEFSHGIVDIQGFDKNRSVIEALRDDVTSIFSNKKLDDLTEREKMLVAHYFFSPDANLPVDEIIADVIAWQQKGGGLYGSGVILGVDNPELMPDLFPSLSAKVKSLT